MDIRNKVLSALRWTAAARFMGQLASWVITIIVIRLLSPSDYGMMAMAVVLISFLTLLNTIGLDAVLVQKKDLNEETWRQVFGVVIIVNILFTTILFLTASYIADFYEEPRLTLIIRVLSIEFIFLIFETLPQSRLERDIEFKHRSIAELITMVIGSLTTLALALLGYGVWALVWGMLVTTASRMLGLNLIARNLVWPSFSLKGMKKNFAFGSFVATDRGLWFLFSETDKFIGGKLLGKQLLGYYVVASHLASLPIEKVAGLLNAVAFPAFSHAHASTDKVADYLLKATRILSIVSFPVFLGMSCTAEAIIALVLGEKWLPAAPLLQLLGLVMPFRMISNLFPPLLWGIGRPGVSATNYLIAAILMPVALYIGANEWSVVGLAYAWLGMYPVIFFITVFRSCPLVGLNIWKYFAQMLRPVIAGAVMYAAVYGLSLVAIGKPADWYYLAQLVAMGAVVYLGVMMLINREGMRETMELIRR
ncbi:MAG TPA: lipopolysaccharide biosynthesis protein [Acidiferrobacteraceae bacterium]|nr:lipopolysaccharide biosynthesis protein [Acidiferrobacteraceae bacterium]HEX19451.1 lipopolysaccharide biosynthesis protein [Acidiferrobacteraceae bacterium]